MVKKQFKSKVLVLSLSFCSYLIVACVNVSGVAPASPASPARPVVSNESCETEVADSDEDILTIKKQRYKLMEGDIYKCRKGKWKFENTLKREPVKHIKFKKTAKGCEVHDTKTGAKRVGGTTLFSNGFEESSFLKLFHNKGWTITTLLSPRADTVKKYMKLNRKLMSGGAFLDNRLDLQGKKVHSGQQALRLFAVKPSSRMVTSKSLIEKKELCFGKDDHIWFSAWYYLEKGVPSTIVDFENRLFKNGPGMRLFIRNNKFASMELKFAHKPQFNQYKVEIPRQKWVHIKLHLVLSNHDDGVIELWQDGEKILSTTGQTLPTHDSIYNALQVGITATSMKTVLLVDDVKISDQPF